MNVICVIHFDKVYFVSSPRSRVVCIMPRTKQVKKSSFMKRHKRSGSFLSDASSISLSSSASPSSEPSVLSKEYESPELFLGGFNIYSHNILKKHQEKYEISCNEIKKMFADIKGGLPESTKHLLVFKYANEVSIEDQNKDPNTTSASSSRQSRARKILESFDFKKPKTPQMNNRSSSCKRSTSVSSARKRSASATSAPISNIDNVKTPLMSCRKLPIGATITPKIYSDTPMSVMRRPLHGEVAISMSGSPLMVGAMSREDIPTVNVPLGDGRVFSIMPQAGAPPSDLPGFDETTKQYLKTLRAHLEILAPNSP